ncbi:NUDIX domain-containing protein [Vibrio marisflavi]|uniref:Nudix hydrolase domain-containing protein n=1 Tax=Vibrio marisflavi CECT 7928 TaxID=634439 RepID=A0ABM9A3V1_9VIBR|nr:NUDIX domain-containing protein [Vibrio marisflavi]CAH0539215.1 hypothetical protein VMF7928_01983 [Vibrio marisflavi CECT 7928]
MQHRIRSAGILLSGSKILMLKVKDFSGDYWILPGGGFEAGDRSTKHSLEREFEEETGLVVEVGPLVCVREFLETSQNRYNAEFFYCITDYSGELTLSNLQGLNDEEFIQSVQWVELSELKDKRIYPHDLATTVMDIIKSKRFSTHLGSFVQGNADSHNQL